MNHALKLIKVGGNELQKYYRAKLVNFAMFARMCLPAIPIMRIKIALTCLLLALCCSVSHAQDKDKANDLVKKAIDLEDAGKYDDALPLLEQAVAADGVDYSYTYELGYCYYAKKDYEKALSIMKKVPALNSAKDDAYQMLGNLYDITGDSVKALKTYSDGLKKFPHSGRLYLETANVYFNREQYGKAMPYYEKGIAAEPSYPSNYYRAAQLYLSSDNAAWGMIYGELFMNLERNTDRTAQMSKWLYDAYKQRIIIHSKDSMEVNFCRNMVMGLDDLKRKDNIRLPFCMIYEPTMLLALVAETAINTESMCNIRKNFLKIYYEQKFDVQYPNVLFDYQKNVTDQGQADAYHHWILMKGDEAAFSQWQNGHMNEWNTFIQWFSGNKIKITNENKWLSE
jgi:tetratricopeptide (TPR) repeat protein